MREWQSGFPFRGKGKSRVTSQTSTIRRSRVPTEVRWDGWGSESRLAQPYPRRYPQRDKRLHSGRRQMIRMNPR